MAPGTDRGASARRRTDREAGAGRGHPGAGGTGGERLALEVDGHRLNAVAWSGDRGAGRPAGDVLVVPGLGGSCVDWEPAARLLAEATGGGIVAIDLPGFGRSRLPRGRAGIPLYASVVAGVLEQLGPRIVAGSSMGGLVALLAAHRRGDLVEGLVLADPALPSGHRSRGSVLPALRWLLTATPLLGPRAVQARKRLLGVDRHVEQRLRANLHRLDAVDDGVRQAMVALARERLAFREAGRCYSDAVRSIVSCWSEGLAAAAEVGVPGLVIHGRSDRIVPVSVAEDLGAIRPDWRVEILDRCGHLPHLEAPQRFVDAVTRWLSTSPETTSSPTS